MAAKKKAEVTVTKVTSTRIVLPSAGLDICDLPYDETKYPLTFDAARVTVEVTDKRVYVTRETDDYGRCDDVTVFTREDFDKLIEAVK